MNTRLGIRVSEKLRAELDQAVKSGQYENMSEMIRRIAEDYLEKSKKEALLPKKKVRSGETQN